ncbi:hypothetical protein PI125_g26287 [Phytophthora idaei]|nr:hypothetical protein PI125_g26287 [Phytophthora idaei]
MTEEIQSSLEGTQGKFSNDMTGTEGSKINGEGLFDPLGLVLFVD